MDFFCADTHRCGRRRRCVPFAWRDGGRPVRLLSQDLASEYQSAESDWRKISTFCFMYAQIPDCGAHGHDESLAWLESSGHGRPFTNNKTNEITRAGMNNEKWWEQQPTTPALFSIQINTTKFLKKTKKPEKDRKTKMQPLYNSFAHSRSCQTALKCSWKRSAAPTTCTPSSKTGKIWTLRSVSPGDVASYSCITPPTPPPST